LTLRPGSDSTRLVPAVGSAVHNPAKQWSQREVTLCSRDEAEDLAPPVEGPYSPPRTSTPATETLQMLAHLPIGELHVEGAASSLAVELEHGDLFVGTTAHKVVQCYSGCDEVLREYVDTLHLQAANVGTPQARAGVFAAERLHCNTTLKAPCLVAVRGSQLVTGSRYGSVRFWDTESGECVRTVPTRTGVLAMCLCEDFVYVAAWEFSGVLQISVESGEVKQIMRQGPPGAWYTALCSSEDGATVYAASSDGCVYGWDTATATCSQTFGQSSTATSSHGLCSALADGGLVWTSSKDGVVSAWETGTGENCVEPLAQLLADYHSVAAIALYKAGDVQCIAAGCSDGSIKIFNTSTGELVDQMQGHVEAVTSLAVDGTRELLYSASTDGTVLAWDLETIRSVSEAPGDAGEAAEASADMILTAAAERDRRMRQALGDLDSMRGREPAARTALNNGYDHTFDRDIEDAFNAMDPDDTGLVATAELKDNIKAMSAGEAIWTDLMVFLDKTGQEQVSRKDWLGFFRLRIAKTGRKEEVLLQVGALLDSLGVEFVDPGQMYPLVSEDLKEVFDPASNRWVENPDAPVPKMPGQL